MSKRNIIKHLLATPFAIFGVCIFRVAEFIAGKKYTYRSQEVKDRILVDNIISARMKRSKSQIMEELTKLTREQGISFFSEKDAEDYFKNLVELIERLSIIKQGK